ncbi:TomO hydrophobic C-terminal domain-containing protein [Wolbachia endosymbiont (group A) of Epistrophe grossularia]|uniref:TomO hydrophobic C-terminal domain-containing protein n=1 Tax=Wolbachia endosymbiont (group A) of Epistrophe grossularia TaxID=2954008 RepID=UPI00222FB539|nr:hypothetical protein [Wolbachia endosymbiont (group A) of Epistrophe grossularia]
MYLSGLYETKQEKRPSNLSNGKGKRDSSKNSSTMLNHTSSSHNSSNTPNSIKDFNISASTPEANITVDISPTNSVTSPEVGRNSSIILDNNNFGNFDNTIREEENDDRLNNELTSGICVQEHEKIGSFVQKISRGSSVSPNTEEYSSIGEESFVTAKDQSYLSEDNTKLSHNQQVICFHNQHSGSEEGSTDTLVDFGNTEESSTVEINNTSTLDKLEQEEKSPLSTKKLDNAIHETSQLEQNPISTKKELNKRTQATKSKKAHLAERGNLNYKFTFFILSGICAVGAGLTIPYLAICIPLAVAAFISLATGCYYSYKANTALKNVEVDQVLKDPECIVSQNSV